MLSLNKTPNTHHSTLKTQHPTPNTQHQTSGGGVERSWPRCLASTRP